MQVSVTLEQLSDLIAAYEDSEGHEPYNTDIQNGLNFLKQVVLDDLVSYVILEEGEYRILTGL